MAVVNVNPGESIESALRRFKRKVMTEEIIKDAKKHAFFMPPGQKGKTEVLRWLASATRRKLVRVLARLLKSQRTSETYQTSIHGKTGWLATFE
jgi:small subunit ribosomal protein S21